MTITIDVRWIDKMCYWNNKHSDDLRRYFYLALLILSPLALIFGMIQFINTLQFDGNFPLHFAVLLSGSGFVGTVILSYLIAGTLITLNNEHKWFALRRGSP